MAAASTNRTAQLLGRKRTSVAAPANDVAACPDGNESPTTPRMSGSGSGIERNGRGRATAALIPRASRSDPQTASATIPTTAGRRHTSAEPGQRDEEPVDLLGAVGDHPPQDVAVELGQVGSICFADSISCWGSNGLPMKPDAPRFVASCAEASSTF